MKNNNDMIYLDNNATTPCDPRVVEAMLPYFSEIYGNPSNGLNSMGRQASLAVEKAREEMGTFIGARSNEIIFTGNATEANNLAILGFCRRNRSNGRNKIITTAIEHKSVLKAFEKLESEGFELEIIPVNNDGVVDLAAFRDAVDQRTLLVSMQAVNNEIGTIQPINEAVDHAHSVGAVFHCDASQAIGKMGIDTASIGIDLMSVSAHKFYGPKGIGVLFGRGNILTKHLEPIVYGGGQERDVRPGTYNVPLIVGLGKAAELLKTEMEEEIQKIRGIREVFEELILKNLADARINGLRSDRIANTSNLTLAGIEADALLLNCPQLMMGTGSACNAGAIEPSYVLGAMGIERNLSASTIRLGFGRFNVIADAKIAFEAIQAASARLR